MLTCCCMLCERTHTAWVHCLHTQCKHSVNSTARAAAAMLWPVARVLSLARHEVQPCFWHCTQHKVGSCAPSTAAQPTSHAHSSATQPDGKFPVGCQPLSAGYLRRNTTATATSLNCAIMPGSANQDNALLLHMQLPPL